MAVTAGTYPGRCNMATYTIKKYILKNKRAKYLLNNYIFIDNACRIFFIYHTLINLSAITSCELTALLPALEARH